MILSFVLALFIIAFFLQLGKRSKLSVFVLFLGILITAAAGSGPVTDWALATLQPHTAPVNPQWKSTNLLIVLGSGQTRWSTDYVSPQVFAIARTAEAARLYFNCKKSGNACTIITAGGDPGANGEAEAVTMKSLLLQLGVNEADVLVEAESRNTYENAKNVFKIIGDRSFENKLLVTSGFHMKRSEICFQLNGMSVAAAPADRVKAYTDLLPHSGNLYFINLVAHEYAGILKAYFLNMTGLSF